MATLENEISLVGNLEKEVILNTTLSTEGNINANIGIGKGIKGDKGDKGDRGEPGIGIQGPKGDKGDRGEKGEATKIFIEAGYPSYREEKPGDMHINYSTWAISLRTEDEWEDIGQIKGEPGSTILTGAGTPGPFMGKNLDLFINTLTGEFYKKIEDEWTLQGSLQLNTDENLLTNDKSIVGAINENFTCVSNGKNLLDKTITDKGTNVIKQGSIATFQELAEAIKNISGTEDKDKNLLIQTLNDKFDLNVEENISFYDLALIIKSYVLTAIRKTIKVSKKLDYQNITFYKNIKLSVINDNLMTVSINYNASLENINLFNNFTITI